MNNSAHTAIDGDANSVHLFLAATEHIKKDKESSFVRSTKNCGIENAADGFFSLRRFNPVGEL